MKTSAFFLLKRFAFIALGIVAAAFGIESFLLPNHFIDGGAVGVSMLLAETVGLPLSVWIVIVNIPFLLMGWQQIGRMFAFGAGATIVVFSCVLFTVHFPPVTTDKLLAAVFGGFFLGGGIGLVIRGNSALDGTEIFALVVSKQFGISLGDVILGVNIFIFGAAAWLLGVERGLYSLLTYMAASKTVDFIVYGVEEFNGVVLITPQSETMRRRISEELHRGVTIYKGKGGFSGEDIEILYCVITRLEIPRLKAIIRNVDPEAFVVFQSLNDAHGGMTQRLANH